MDLLPTILLDDILPIFVVASVGFLLARRLHVDVKSLSRVTFNALAPCMVFSLLVSSRVSSGEFGRIVAFTVLLVAAIGLVARVAAIPFRLTRPQLAAFMIVVMFSNAGNYGLSVVLFAFGREVLARAAVYFVTSALLMYTWDLPGFERAPRRTGGASRTGSGSGGLGPRGGRAGHLDRRRSSEGRLSSRRAARSGGDPRHAAGAGHAVREGRPAGAPWLGRRRLGACAGRVADHRIPAGAGPRPYRSRPACRAGRISHAERRDHHHPRAGIRPGSAVL